jgi:hypothetical protein
MTIYETLAPLLEAICPRTFVDFAAVETERPYCTYQVIGGDALDYIDNALPNKKNGMVQVTIWSDTRLEAAALIDQVEVAMLAATNMQASPLGAAVDDFDVDMEVRSSSQDFSVWVDR